MTNPIDAWGLGKGCWSRDETFWPWARRLERWGHPRVSTVIALGLAGVYAIAGYYVEAMALVLAAVGTQVIVEPLRRGVRRSRPDTTYASGRYRYSFPSGHPAAATAVYGLMAVLCWRGNGVAVGLLAVALAGGWVALVGYARLYLRAHWATDVLAGVLIGLVVLWGCTKII